MSPLRPSLVLVLWATLAAFVACGEEERGSSGAAGSGGQSLAPSGGGGAAAQAGGGLEHGGALQQGNPGGHAGDHATANVGGRIGSGGRASADSSGARAAMGGAVNAGGATTLSEGGTAPSPENDGGAPANLGGSSSGTPLPKVDVFIAGDSTVQTYPDTASETDQAGWGQMLAARATGPVQVNNHAVGGRTARRFIDEGRLDAIAKELTAGDYLIVQFGTNDGNKTATYTLNGETIPYYLDPATDFKTYLERYVEVARSQNATAVLVTPPPRNSAYCTGGNGTGAHASAMRELAQEMSVPLVDLNRRSVDYLKAICPAPTPEDFFLVRADGSVDGTHFQERGARLLAGFVLEEIERLELPLAAYFESP